LFNYDYPDPGTTKVMTSNKRLVIPGNTKSGVPARRHSALYLADDDKKHRVRGMPPIVNSLEKSPQPKVTSSRINLEPKKQKIISPKRPRDITPRAVRDSMATECDKEELIMGYRKMEADAAIDVSELNPLSGTCTPTLPNE